MIRVGQLMNTSIVWIAVIKLFLLLYVEISNIQNKKGYRTNKILKFSLIELV